MLIREIYIKNFRSISEQKFKVDNFNILVGNNDAGKSNILKALNLFFKGQTDHNASFDFSKDYSLYPRRGKQKAKEIVIELAFKIPETFKDKGEVRWKKVWRERGLKNDDVKKRSKISKRSKVEDWLRKIQYRYVPAVKSNLFLENLLKDTYAVFEKTVDADLKKTSKTFIDSIRNHTRSLASELRGVLGFDSELQIPDDMSNLFAILDFETNLDKENKISFSRRGDGVKGKHIPAILKFLAEKEILHHRKGDVREDTIWGYEEPENNIEMSAAFEFREKFLEYSKDIQMFVTTHSPVFYKLEASKRFFVYKKDNQTGLQAINESDVENKTSLDRDMGLLPLIAPFVEEKAKEINLLQSVIKGLREEKDLIVCVEGDTDQKMLNAAWEKLHEGEEKCFCIKNLFDCYQIKNLFAREEAFRNNPEKIFVGLFDFDSAYKCWREAEEKGSWVLENKDEKTGLLLRHKEKKAYLLLLPIPAHREKYAGRQYGNDSKLAMELLFSDQKLSGFVSSEEVVGGAKMLFMKEEKKRDFANRVCGFSKGDFLEFERIFEMIRKIRENEAILS